jgi:osmotically-inducible protein OsmY
MGMKLATEILTIMILIPLVVFGTSSAWATQRAKSDENLATEIAALEDRLYDEQIQENVKAALARDPYLDASRITIVVRNGEADLYGTVSSRFDRMHAESVASRARGVIEVNNQIEVPRIETLAAKSDWEVLQNIESALFWSSVVDSVAVKITVEDGVATLRRRFETWAEREQATEIAF